MASLISTYMIDQIVSIQYLVGSEVRTEYGKLVDCDSTFVRILSGDIHTVRVVDQKHVGSCGTPKTVFKLANPTPVSSYEMFNIQYIIGLKAIGNIDHIIEYGQNAVVCDDRGNCEVVYNHGPLRVVLERGGE